MEQVGGLPALALISTAQINGKDLPGTTAVKQQRRLWKGDSLVPPCKVGRGGGTQRVPHLPYARPWPKGVRRDGLVGVWASVKLEGCFMGRR